MTNIKSICESCSKKDGCQTYEQVRKAKELYLVEGCDKFISDGTWNDVEKEPTNIKLMLMEANINGYTEGLKDSSKSETVTEFADRCRECGARYGKLLKQKTGHWIVWDTSSYDWTYKCDKCGNIEFRQSNYCPNCGARMESEEK